MTVLDRTSFRDRIGTELRRVAATTVQVNVGKHCNQACTHCHVEAGPLRKERMTGATVDRIIALLRRSPDVQTVDITGGAPELNPHFRRLVVAARERGLHVIDRCNLTILLEPGQEDTADFLAENGVEVIASLPCYSAKNVEQQRGKGVFAKSIEGLRALNALGYASAEGPALNLVYNPNGAFLPPSQAGLAADYHTRLWEDFGVRFSDLFTITNMPIARFEAQLARSGGLEAYQQLLEEAFNPSTVDGLMCRTQLSISWDGRLFDCDFNQMLEISCPTQQKTVWDIEAFSALDRQPIALAAHCFGCTAGAGSSCGGAIK